MGWVFASCATARSARRLMRRAIKQRRHSCQVPRAAGTAASCFWVAMSPKEESQMKSGVIVVEDHPVLSDGLKQFIDKQPDLACVGVADNTSDAKRLVEQFKPDLML